MKRLRRPLLVTLDDELFALLAVPTVGMPDNTELTCVPASSLSDPDRDADMWLGRYVPSAVGRSMFFQAESGAVYECDGDAHVWRDGRPVARGGVLVDFASLGTGQRGMIMVSETAELIFRRPTSSGHRLQRIRCTSPVLIIGRLPPLPAEPRRAPGPS